VRPRVYEEKEEEDVNLPKSKAFVAATAVAVAASVAIGTGASAASTHSRARAHVAGTISLSQFSTSNFNAMAQLKSIAAKGSGKIAAILPDTTSSLRWADFDAPDIKKAALAAGIPSSDIIVQNAGGSDATFYTDAQADITNGAKVLLTAPEDSGTGTKVEKYAAAHGVKVIDYDRLTLGGSRPYYVSFNNVKVGQLIGNGFVACVAAWHVSHPNVIVMHGAPTDNNATLFYTGYFNDVLQAKFKSGAYTNVAPPYLVGNWTPPQMLTEFQAAYTAHPNANSMVNPNDETAQPIINYLVNKGVKPDTFPATGQDATLPGLQAIIAGYQCGTVYKPIGLEAQAAIAIAVYLRAHETPPKTLVNGTTEDIQEHKAVPSALATPEWVTKANMATTVVKDNFVPKSQICGGTFDGKVSMASACSKAPGL
jgi:D-xylose transport system substrate-binding protein